MRLRYRENKRVKDQIHLTPEELIGACIKAVIDFFGETKKGKFTAKIIKDLIDKRTVTLLAVVWAVKM